RFDEEPPNHGHHTASAILAREAFVAAADPKRFPEQLEQGLQPWKAERLLHNFPTWRGDAPPAGAIAVDVGGYDVRLGLGYGELAAFSRSQHKSQGFGSAGERGRLIEHFVHVAGSKPAKDLLEGVELGWARFGKPGQAFAIAIDEAKGALDRDRPEKAVPALVKAFAALDALPDVPRVRDARSELDRVLAGAAGLFVRATAERPSATPGSQIGLKVEVVARRPTEVVLHRVTWPGGAGEQIEKPSLGINEKRVFTREVKLAADAEISTPYWLARSAKRGRYDVADPALIGAPRGTSALTVGVELVVGGKDLHVDVPVVHAWTDRVHGERVRPFLVVPPATVTPTRDAVLSANGKPAPVELRVRAGAGGVRGDVTLELPKGWISKPASHPVSLDSVGDEVTVRFEVTPGKNARPVEVRPSIRIAGRTWSLREDVIDYPHIPLQVVLQPASLRVAPVSLKIPEGLVGYIPGSGDSIPEDLLHVGVPVEILDEATIRSGDLSRYAAIVVGIRAYNARPVMRVAHERLMKFVEQGGTVVVQYNTTHRWDPFNLPIGPFPLTLSNGRITDETAAMTPVNPKHPLLRAPNLITEADFEGWVQERGIYFADKWDDRYEPLFRAADPGEKPLEGGTLFARHGKGQYVYTGLAFFRQLRAGVPGAYRLFVNFIGASRSADE
ncbi:MAG: PIG-L family deacetylase, partial [Myxococcaceae bacterium]